MGAEKKIPYFQIVNAEFSAVTLALSFFVVSLLVPTQLFTGGGSLWTDQIDRPERKEAYELLTIYSLLKPHSVEERDASTWTIAKTILYESKKHLLDPLLILAIISVESRFQPEALSTEGARGLMQIRPVVANALAQEVELESWEGEKSLDDPIFNIKLGVFYLHYLKKRFRDLKLALTAYNWGPTEIKNRLLEDEAVPLEYAMKVLSTYYAYYAYLNDIGQTDKNP